ncbi:MAG TPA: ZIP family metal transporter [Blastocatellia bacterium]|nr:ZIP family metal transporter [Blastocatellia bacterium]
MLNFIIGMRFTYILIFSLLGSVGALTGAGALLLFPKLHDRLKTILLSYAVGTLLGATFLGLIPEAIEHHPAKPVLLVILAGLFGFFLVEKILRLPHIHGHASEHRDHEREPHTLQPAGFLILVGDAFHNFVDGIVIATAFSVSIQLGVLTSLAVIAHEVPQELGDFTILLQSGWSPRRAYWMNSLSALATLPGALLGYLALHTIEPHIPYLLAIAAASFLYIATVDLAPILHHESGFKKSLLQLAGLLLGTGTIAGLHRLLG